MDGASRYKGLTARYKGYVSLKVATYYFFELQLILTQLV